MKIAIAHDSFTQMGGAERVVDALHELFPEAPIFTLVFDPQYNQKYKDWNIKTSELQVLYLALGKIQYLLPLIPWGVDNLDFSGYDLVISSSSGWMKNIRVPKNCIHINYCHTPTRFLWSEPDYIKQEVSWYQRPFVSAILKRMKVWDYNGAQRVAKFIANSKEVQKRIKLYYKRDSEVIYPFVDTDFWKLTESSPSFLKRGLGGVSESRHHEESGALAGRRGDHSHEKIASTYAKAMVDASDVIKISQRETLAMTNGRTYFLLAGRLHAHKNNELIIEIFNELGLPLHVVGDGRQKQYLESISKPNIKFFGRLSDDELRIQYGNAIALVFPQVEDFGLVPLEAAACGTPTLAYGRGGVLETIVAGVTGEFFSSYEKNEIKKLIVNWNSDKYKVNNLIRQVENFSKNTFKFKIEKAIKNNA